jgi:hypothetical protein
VEHYLIIQRRRALGEKVLAMAGKVHVDKDVYDLIDGGRRDDRT